MMIFLLFTFLHLQYSVHCVKVASPRMRLKLEAEEQNNFCCKHNLRCCQTTNEELSGETTTAAKFEIRTFLKDCPNTDCYPNNMSYSSVHKIVVHNNNSTSPPKLTNCKQKLLLTIKVINEGQPTLKSQYVIIDHIIDRDTMKKINILNPFAVRIRQEPLVEMYNLDFVKSVNGEASERVYRRNERGCDVCDAVRHEGRIVPYSTGFCCSCNSNPKRRVYSPNTSLVRDDAKNYKNRPHHYGFRGSRKDSNNNKNVESDVYDGTSVAGQKRADKSVNYQRLKDANLTLRQRRGTQNCNTDINLSSIPGFLDSTHCLTFSSTWYSLFEMEKPRIMHSLKIQIFQKYEDCRGTTHWLDLTQGRTIELSNENPHGNDQDIGIVSHYSFGDSECPDVLDYKNNVLLVPEQIASPDKFMIIPNAMVSHDGKKCNSVGVGYEAFYKQRKRCLQPIGSCLGNQPEHLKREDLQADANGKRGNYFLKFYADLPPENALGYDSKGQLESIKLVYKGRHVSALNFEINADLVTLMKPNLLAIISEVYTESTSPQRTQIVAKIINSGLLYGVYYVRLNECPLSVPASLNNIASKSVLIAAQHQHIFKLSIEFALPSKEISCFIHVHNINQELIASRQIRIRSLDRCICVWHCKCACYQADKGLKCTPLTLDEYHAAGYQGGLPTPSQLIESTSLDELLTFVFHMFIILILTLLAMGLIKALLGLCISEIGLWGLKTILGTNVTSSTSTRISTKSSKCHCNDESDGKDGDEDDGLSTPAQFCLNVIFFCIYPLTLCNLLMRKLCFVRHTNEKRSSESVCFHSGSLFCGDLNCGGSTRTCSASKKKSSQDNDDDSGRTGKCCSLIYTSSDDKEVQCVCTE